MLAAVAALLMVGCAAYTPPQKHDFDKTKSFNKDYDAVWNKIIGFFASKNIPIKTVDKNSGFITTEYDLLTNPFWYMDCGEGGSKTQARATINLTATKEGDKTTVTVNTFFSCHLKYMGATTGADNRIDCVSNGRFEKELFDFIEK